VSDHAPRARAVDLEAAWWFFEDSDDLLLILEAGVVQRANAAFSAVTGWTAADLAERSVWELAHPRDRLTILKNDRLIARGRMVRFEHRLRRKDGGWLWVRCQAKLAFGGNVVAVLQDITETKAQKREIREMQRSADLLRTAAGVSIWRYDPDTQVFVYGQESGEQTAYQHQEQPYESVSGSIHPDDSPRVLAQWEETLKSGVLHICEYRKASRSRGKDGWRRVRTAWRGARLAACGQWQVLGLTQDITELAAARDAAVAGEQAAQAAAEIKAQFLANMSHEIRTPMNGVLGVLHLLKHEPLSDESRRMIDEALGCGSMLAELLNDVIDFSKIEAGKLELNAQPIELSACVDSVAQLMRGQAEAKGLTLTTKVPPEAGWAMVDPVRLRQMLFNLIGNAVKFTLAGGVEVRLTTVGDGAAQRLRAEVQDSGIGISPEAQRRLFERFSQADGSTTRRFGGSGLGLAISRKLAQIMGGEVGVESVVGVGSTFWFEIAAPACAAAPAAETADVRWLEGLKVLVVEDNPTNRLIATKMLEHLGGQVSCVGDGAQGVEAVRTGGFDLVFMDIQMPVMDGVEATRAIRALPAPACATPIVAMTANALSHQIAGYRAAGMDGSVAKPLSPAALLAELARLSGDDQPERKRA
jgi:PAS domain S-box-containing protein